MLSLFLLKRQAHQPPQNEKKTRNSSQTPPVSQDPPVPAPPQLAPVGPPAVPSLVAARCRCPATRPRWATATPAARMSASGARTSARDDGSRRRARGCPARWKSGNGWNWWMFGSSKGTKIWNCVWDFPLWYSEGSEGKFGWVAEAVSGVPFINIPWCNMSGIEGVEKTSANSKDLSKLWVGRTTNTCAQTCKT